MPPRNLPSPQIVRGCSVSFVPRCGVPWGASWPGVFTGRETTNVPRFVRGCCRVQGIWVCWHVRWLSSWDFHPDGLAAPSGKAKVAKEEEEELAGKDLTRTFGDDNLKTIWLSKLCTSKLYINIYIYNYLGEMGRCSNLTYTALLCLTGRKKKPVFRSNLSAEIWWIPGIPKMPCKNLMVRMIPRIRFQILGVFQPEHPIAANLLPNLSLYLCLNQKKTGKFGMNTSVGSKQNSLTWPRAVGGIWD